MVSVKKISREKEITTEELAIMVNKGFTYVQEEFTETYSRFDSIDARFDIVDERFERVDFRFDSMDKKLDIILRNMATKHDLKRLEVRIEKLEESS